MPDQAQDVRPDERRAEGSVASSALSLLVIVPALLLLRFLGDHAWAYWSAAVIGGLGAVLAVFEIVNAVRSLLRRRRTVASVWVVLLLAGALFALVVRLVER